MSLQQNLICPNETKHEQSNPLEVSSHPINELTINGLKRKGRKKGEKDIKLAGIYSLRNLINNRRYIGRSTNLASRIGGHLSSLRCGRHSNWGFQMDWRAFGPDQFVVEILEDYTGYSNGLLEKLKERESYYLRLGQDQSLFYNQVFYLRFAPPHYLRGKFKADQAKQKSLIEAYSYHDWMI